MKKSIINAFYLFSLLTLAACSSEESVNGGSIDAARDITFEFSEESFQPGKLSGPDTRAAQTPQVFDLGNGMVAEATLEPDSSCMKQTRAGGTTISDGDYQIYAVDNATNTRYDGLEGTITNGKFTPKNPNAKWQLAPGNYTFVCYNKIYSNPQYPQIATNIHDSGDKLIVYLGQNTMMGITEHTINAGDKVYRVPFVMRHLTARIRVQIDTYTAPMKNAHFDRFLGDVFYTTQTFDLKGNEDPLQRGYAGPPAYSTDFESTPAYTPSDKTIEYKNISKDALYLADGSQINLVGGGTLGMFPFIWTSTSTLYGKKLADVDGNSKLIGPAGGLPAYTTILQKNYSYTWHFKIRPAVLYLYSDGTVGTIGDKGNRTPIGVVINEKQTDSDKGMAIALTNASDFAMYDAVGLMHYSRIKTESDFSDMKGYEYTYTTVAYNDNYYTHTAEPVPTVPPCENVFGYGTTTYANFPAYYDAAHYPVTATGTNVGKWFLPSLGQWKVALMKLGKLKDSDFPTIDENSYGGEFGTATWDGEKVSKYFTDAGGDLKLTQSGYNFYHISGTRKGRPFGLTQYQMAVGLYKTKISWTADDYQEIGAAVRPFVYF